MAEFDAMKRHNVLAPNRSDAIALPSAGGGQRVSFWQGDLLKPPSQKPPEALFWQFHVLEAIMDVDILALATILEMLDSAKLQGGFKISRVPPEATLYVLGSETFSSAVEGTSGLLGSDFAFEKRKLRARIGRWLEMLGAQEGDTLLHLALRISGADERQKTAIVVEILGHGASFEVANARDQLPTQIDPICFKHAFFKVLPVWRRAQEQLRAQEKTATDVREATAEHEARMARRMARRAARYAAEAEAARLAEVRAEEERVRIAHHQKLHLAMNKVAKKEARDVFRDQGGRERIKDLAPVLAALGISASWVQRVIVDS
tara:strand:- start:2381 stop:3337 length:957 start_codon:yes stop_codon:yes gene_type:complete